MRWTTVSNKCWVNSKIKHLNLSMFDLIKCLWSLSFGCSNFIGMTNLLLCKIEIIFINNVLVFSYSTSHMKEPDTHTLKKNTMYCWIRQIFNDFHYQGKTRELALWRRKIREPYRCRSAAYKCGKNFVLSTCKCVNQWRMHHDVCGTTTCVQISPLWNNLVRGAI